MAEPPATDAKSSRGSSKPTEGANVAPDSTSLVIAKNVYPPHLSIVPLPTRPLFPKTVTPLLVVQRNLVELVETAMSSQERLIGLVLRKQADEEAMPGNAPQAVATYRPDELHKVGVIAQILKVQQVPNTDHLQILTGGLDRFTIKTMLLTEPHLIAEVEYLHEEATEVTSELRAYALAVINSVRDLVALNPLFKQELNLLLQQGNIEEPGRLADFAAYLTTAKGEELQEVLETLDVRRRLERALELLRREIDISKLQVDIRTRIEERISKQQREFFLREQLKAIRRELGLEKDDKDAEIERFVARLADKKVSEEAQARIDEEVGKLRTLEPASPEYGVTRNYLDLVTSLPWGVTSEGEVTLAQAEKVLASHHHGLEDVKERIIEHIAAGLLRGSFAGSIILLVGPPGVGKTSIGRSIAQALARPFYRFSLGGMRDEAEIKGHRRTYIGAMPGKFIQAIRTAGTCDPVIMLDEIDKIGASFRGDPASALLEALDPEQNVEFLDHYLDLRFDLSTVLFVCTANQLDTIPPPLLDRMEVIKLSGYLVDEKLEIARRHLVPRQLDAHGLKKDQLRFDKAALREIVEGYARDAGVRTLDKMIQKIARKTVVEVLSKRTKAVRVGAEDVGRLLGPRAFREEAEAQKPRLGVVRGLAWTSMGGDTLLVEAAAVKTGHAGFKQTGQLGSVMVESSEIAYTYARTLSAEQPGGASFFAEHFIHLHVPAGATPKDGPSAGVTMCAALYTLVSGHPIRPGFAMTGELDLSGEVLPVGGIQEKLIAARRAKVKNVILPAANQGDYETLPETVKRHITIHFVSHFAEVIALCLAPPKKKRG
jgi:ATP-dependent Lon protease